MAMIPLWTLPLALAALLTIGGWIGAWRRSRSRRDRMRPAWDVPDGVSARDVRVLAETHGWVMIYDTPTEMHPWA